MKIVWKEEKKTGNAAALWGGASGIAAGASLMYWLDPSNGARRRAEVYQQAAHLLSEAGHGADTVRRDLAGRSVGVFHELRARLSSDHPSDDVLVERVRAKLGRVCSHPGVIAVSARNGEVELKGPILDEEVEAVLKAVKRVRGVQAIDNDLEVHTSAESVPGLQGAGKRPGERFELMQESWAPAVRLLGGMGGVTLVTAGLAKGGVSGAAATGIGAALLGRSLANIPMKRLVGAGAGRRAVNVQKAIHIAASPEEVFAFFRAFDNFPRFMTHLKEVRPVSEGRWHWEAAGPVGTSFEWDAEVTKFEPGRILAWKSVPGSTVESAGIVRFDAESNGTRLSVRMSYNPPAGAVGHAFAKLLGSDPKKQMDDDLLRLKSLIETGKATGREGTVEKDQLRPQ